VGRDETVGDCMDSCCRCVDGDNQRGKAIANTPQRKPYCHIAALMYLITVFVTDRPNDIAPGWP